MNLLLIDTCGATGSLALASTAPQPAPQPALQPAVLATATLPGRSASERLVPAIRSLIAEAGTTLQSLGAIAIIHGPGSFTGERVGLSAAKGLAEALNLPLIAISRLAVLANLAQLASTRVLALLDAGRGELYLGEYLDGACLREALVTRDELLALATATPRPAIVTCEPTLAAALAPLAVRLLAEPTAADALPLALRRLQQNSFDDPVQLDANYLRRTDAQIFAKPGPKSPSKSPIA